jgi:hypothetical protein
MTRDSRKQIRLLAGFTLLAASVGGIATFGSRGVRAADKPAEAAKTRYFEMRTYHTPAGKLDALNARFRDHTVALFKKHDIESIGYWTPEGGDGKTLVYVLAYPNKEARETSWKAFQDDPEWKRAKEESERDGKLVEKVDQLFMTPTDYSPIR